ncbi:MAG: DUF167 domain-containing protein [Janthinobacterium lividum]
MVDWCRKTAKGVELWVYVQPNARAATAASGEFDGVLKVRLQAPPVDGQANAALLEWVAAQVGLPVRRVTLLSGQTMRRKHLLLDDLTLDVAQVVDRLVAPKPGRRHFKAP